jgi:Sap-like sulfolipid-1-addressing protein
MLKLTIAVAAIAVPDSINPSLIAGALYLAAGPRPLWRTAAFTATAFGVTLAGGLLFALGLGDLILSLVPKPGYTLKYALITAAGAVLLVGGAVIWLFRERLSRREAPYAEKARAAGGSAAAMGAGIAGVELLSAFPYFAAITLIVGSPVSQAEKVLLVVFYNVMYALPLFAIVAVCAVAGPRADALLAPMRVWVLTRWPWIVAPLAGAVGIGLVALGIASLA